MWGFLYIVANYWPHILFAVVVIAGVIAYVTRPKPVPVKSFDAIDEEIQAEKIELHNTSHDYALLQESAIRQMCNDISMGRCGPLAFSSMFAAAFRQGAKWQQLRDR